MNRIRKLHALALALLLAACGSTPSPAEKQSMLPLGPQRPELGAGPRDPETFPSRDLIGLTLPELRQRLGRGLLAGEVGPTLIIHQDDGPPLSFIGLGQALADPWVAARLRISREPVVGDWTLCNTVFGPVLGPNAASADRALLVFRGEVLAEIRQPQNVRRAPEERVQPPGESPARAYQRQFEERLATPREHVFLTEPGQLPLADGAAFLRRWHSPRVTANEQITVRCELRRETPLTPVSTTSGGGLSASDMQAIALAPLAVFMPNINADRRDALSEGPATAALLKLGQPVPGGAAAFDRQHKRAWYYPGKDGYGVMAFDLGMIPNNNLTSRGAMAFAGVRNDRVEWIGLEGEPPAGFPTQMMCLDEDFVVGRVRKGCSEYGNFNPVR